MKKLLIFLFAAAFTFSCTDESDSFYGLDGATNYATSKIVNVKVADKDCYVGVYNKFGKLIDTRYVEIHDNTIPVRVPMSYSTRDVRLKTLKKAKDNFVENWHVVATYALEDRYDYDYDVNDVVIEHWTRVTYDTKNNVKIIEDVFVPYGGILNSDEDAVCVAVPANQKNKDIEFGVIDEDFNDVSITDDGKDHLFADNSVNAFVLFDDIRDVVDENGSHKVNLYVKRNVAGAAVVKGDIWYNPFIWNKTKGYYTGIQETNNSDKAVKSSSLKKNYFLTFDRSDEEFKNYPLGVALWGVECWIPSTPGTKIYEAFPTFKQWVVSNGKEAVDWFE